MKDKTKGFMFVLFTAVISGVSIFVNKFGVGGFDPFVFTALKNFLVGIVFLSGVVLFTRLDEVKGLGKKQWENLLAVGVIGGSIPFLLFFAGLQMASAATAAFIHKTMFVWVALIAFVFLGEKLSRIQLLGAFALLAGLTVFAGLPSEIGVGELLIFAATLFWAGEIVLSKHVMKEVSSLIVMTSRMFFGGIVLLLFLLFTGRIHEVALLSTTQWGWISVTSLFLLGYVFTFYTGLKFVKASEATAVLLLGSVITSVLSWGVLGTVLSVTKIVGAIAMLAGISLLATRIYFHKEVVPSASQCPQEL